MSRMNVPPTHSNLLRIQQELQFAQEGYEILDRKREVLTTELLHLAHDAEALQESVWELLTQAYQALAQARMTMGREHVEWAALAVNETVDVDINYRGVMGVPIPMVKADAEPEKMPYSLGDTMATLDGASSGFREIIRRVPELTESLISAWRLAWELRKTQRRVNALDHIFIPDYEDTVEYIESELEEREREAVFRVKMLKAKNTEQEVGNME
jgi:V/A-type H+-transporting ATPase subunit D